MPDLALPDAIQTAADLKKLKLEGGASFRRANNVTTIAWTLAGSEIALTVDLAERTLRAPDKIEPARLARLQAALDKVDAPPRWDAGVRQLYQLARSAVGVDVRQLGDGEREALLALVLLNQRALEFGTDGQGQPAVTVRPLREWVKYRIGDDD